ncbi:hypothetical protein Misp01_00020 [Microtetraspora sp. NBRC 13810]|nr:hypothetical protein Misp01_00020 [Microtetraspora sp. NBRC 13810]
MLGGEPAQLVDGRDGGSLGEEQAEPLFAGEQAQLVHPLDLRRRPGPVGDIRVRRAAPEGEGFVQVANRMGTANKALEFLHVNGRSP